jgi:hypothetical protein
MKSSNTVSRLILLGLIIYCSSFNAAAQSLKNLADSAYGQLTDKRIHVELDSTFSWFRQNPPNPDGSNFLSRWEKTKPLDKYGMMISNQTWNIYRKSWINNPAEATKLENSNPILYYLREAVDHSVAEIKSTVVKHGAVIWKLYNMGYVVKTKDACFAIDLNQPGSEKLADVLDFVIASHVHSDHHNTALLDAMVKAGKPVYSPFYAKGTLISATKEITFGEVKVRFTMNEQADVPVIVSEINCGSTADNYTIYHIADARSLVDLNPTRPINLFILHIANALDVFDAVARVKPDMTVYDHVMELGHGIGKYRWSYQFTYNKIRKQSTASSCVLTWGERLEVNF